MPLKAVMTQRDVIHNWVYQPGEKIKLRAANPILGRNPDDALGRNSLSQLTQIHAGAITSIDNFTGKVVGPDKSKGGEGYLIIDLDKPVHCAEGGRIEELWIIRESPGNLERYQEATNESLWRRLAFWK